VQKTAEKPTPKKLMEEVMEENLHNACDNLRRGEKNHYEAAKRIIATVYQHDVVLIANDAQKANEQDTMCWWFP